MGDRQHSELLPAQLQEAATRLVRDAKAKATALLGPSPSRRSRRAVSGRILGPVLTAVLDARTGQIFYGLNIPRKLQRVSNTDYRAVLASIRDRAHPVLQRSLDTYLNSNRTFNLSDWVPGFHSEFDAVNQALFDRERRLKRPATEEDLKELLMYNVSLRNKLRGVGGRARCQNCQWLTAGVVMVSEDGRLPSGASTPPAGRPGPSAPPRTAPTPLPPVPPEKKTTASTGTPPPRFPSPPNTKVKPLKWRLKRVGKMIGVELLSQGLSYVTSIVVSSRNEDQIEAEMRHYTPQMNDVLLNDPSSGAYIQFNYLRRRAVGPEVHEAGGEFEWEFTFVRVGYGRDEKEAIRDATKDQTMTATKDVVNPEAKSEGTFIPPQVEVEVVRGAPFPSYALATFVNGRERVWQLRHRKGIRSFYFAGIDEMRVSCGGTAMFYLLTFPDAIPYFDHVRHVEFDEDLDITWRYPAQAYQFSLGIPGEFVRFHQWSRGRYRGVKAIVLNRFGDDDVAVAVFPANKATRRALRGLAEVEDPYRLLSRSWEPGFLEVWWVRPENINVVQDFELERRLR